MSNLVWNYTDVALVLEVLPELHEHGLVYRYQVERDGLTLHLSVYHYDGDVGISLYRDGLDTPVFHAAMRGCAGIRRVREKNAEFLEIAPGSVFDRRYDGASSMPFGVRVAIHPSISISLFE